MNFLDPEEWADLEGLEKEYTELDEESIKTLHNRLRPYFLRRIKSEVLQLPAKVCDCIYYIHKNFYLISDALHRMKSLFRSL